MKSIQFHKWLTVCTATAMISLSIPLSTSALEPAPAPANEAKLKAEAIGIAKTFASTLKPKLVGAIQSGGLSHAIQVCSVEAPQIARQLSQDTGWSVKRVSLKPRNSVNANADTFERQVLEQFDKRQKNGEPASAISYAKITDNQYRFMKAQGVGDICLNCHGAAISADVQKTLKARYPNDQATGYSLGEIRGAISLSKSW